MVQAFSGFSASTEDGNCMVYIITLVILGVLLSAAGVAICFIMFFWGRRQHAIVLEDIPTTTTEEGMCALDHFLLQWRNINPWSKLYLGHCTEE